MRQYPNIKGITFRPLNVKGWDRYAASSDGNFWFFNGAQWTKVVPYRTADKKVVIKLHRPGPHGATVALETKDL